MHGGNATLPNGIGPQRQGTLAAVKRIGHLGHIARSVYIGQARLQIGPAYKASTLLGACLDGELARRAHTDRDDNHIARLVGTIGQTHMRHALAFAEHHVDRHAGVAENAVRCHKARDDRGAICVEHGRQNARAAIEHIDAVGMVAQRFGRLHANKAAANHHDAAFTAFRMRTLGCCEHIVPGRQRIIERNERMHVRAALHAGNRRNEGDGARSEQALPVGNLFSARKLHFMSGSIDRYGFKLSAKQRFDAALLIEIGRFIVEVFAVGFALEQIRDERTAIAAIRLVGNHDDALIRCSRREEFRRSHACRRIANNQVVTRMVRHATSPRFPRK